MNKEPIIKQDVFLYSPFIFSFYFWLWYLVSLFTHKFDWGNSTAFFYKVMDAHLKILLSLIPFAALYVLITWGAFLAIAIYKRIKRKTERGKQNVR